MVRGRSMPTYEYECSGCGGQFEFFQTMSEKPKETCETCGGKLTKLLSAGTGLIFKGSGFYITDYKTKSGEPVAPTATGEKTAAVSKDAKPAKTETAAPAKTESKSSTD